MIQGCDEARHEKAPDLPTSRSPLIIPLLAAINKAGIALLAVVAVTALGLSIPALKKEAEMLVLPPAGDFVRPYRIGIEAMHFTGTTENPSEKLAKLAALLPKDRVRYQVKVSVIPLD